jgi:teichuronic acid biosynthesis glycosyltransferase TuaG
MSEPVVSVVMPAYNAEQTLAESVRSVVSQTYADWELIIVDDCSTDGTPGIIAEFAGGDPRIRAYRNGCNRGVAFSRNRGISLSRGGWIAFLDSDDLMTNDKLEKQMAFTRAHNAGISYVATAFMDIDGKRYDYVLTAVKELTYKELLKRNLMSCSSVIVKRDLMEKYLFPDRAKTHEDYAAWMKIVKDAGCAYGLNEPLLIYRLSARSKSANRLTSARMSYNAYRCVGYGAITSAAMTLRYAAHSIRKRMLIKRSER